MGYPRGLKGEQIPLAARIFAVADVWDALRSERLYRPAWPEEKVFAYLQAQAGEQLDPQAVQAFARPQRGEVAAPRHKNHRPSGQQFCLAARPVV